MVAYVALIMVVPLSFCGMHKKACECVCNGASKCENPGSSPRSIVS